MTASVSVFAHKTARGWPRHEDGARAYVLSLSRALKRPYATDAHFAAYETPNGRRLTREAIEELDGIALGVIVFDIDCPTTHGTPEPAPESWREDLRAKVNTLALIHAAPFYYETRGGARIVYTLAEPSIIRSQDDARTWSQDYAIAVAYLSRRFGIDADPACADWQRLYRLPRATRDEGGKPEQWPTIGDPENIGTLIVDASRDDVAVARKASKAFAPRKVLDLGPSTFSGDGHGLLYHLLHARGGLLREHGARAFVIRCPRESEHSTGSTGDGSALLYLPAGGEQVGAIHCMHAHCASMTVRDWVRCYSDHEIVTARRAAGIVRAA